MTKLMEELMAEAKRVQALETEVKTAETQLKNEIGLARQEKYTEIRRFMLEMNQLFQSACPEERLIIYAPGTYKDGNHTWSNAMRIGKQRHVRESSSVWVGIWMTGSQSFEEHYSMVENPDFDDNLWGHSRRTLVDEWRDDTYAYIEEYVAKSIREILSKRIEKATADLNAVNKKHAEYYGTEG